MEYKKPEVENRNGCNGGHQSSTCSRPDKN